MLKNLHDELDTAVLQAYGWSDLTADASHTPGLLTRLVALNVRRAAEEAQGTVRWLRPAFQNPGTAANGRTEAPAKALQNQELFTPISRGPEADLTNNIRASSTQPWPATLPEQVRAVALVLAQAGAALPLAAIEARFKGRGPWKKSLPRILETLEALGRARREGDGWRG